MGSTGRTPTNTSRFSALLLRSKPTPNSGSSMRPPTNCSSSQFHRLARFPLWAVAAGPRRRGDRMSNCVVGSGGSWLPCSTIAEHSVEGCDHFSHDGDDDDLGFFVGVGEAI